MDASGLRLFPGRWNTAVTPVLYTSLHYSCAMLERLMHGAGRLPPNPHYIAITLPAGLSREALDPAALPGWDRQDERASRRFGAAWVAAARSAVLPVPSLVARMDENVLLNPAHPEFPGITHALPRPVLRDRRLFSG